MWHIPTAFIASISIKVVDYQFHLQMLSLTREVSYHRLFQNTLLEQGAKKVVSDSPGLVDFAIGLVNSLPNLSDGQPKIFRRIKITKVL